MRQSIDSIRSQYEDLDASTILQKPTSVLLGISQAASDALAAVGIGTVFDLAASTIFTNAIDICLLALSGTGRFALTGRVPRDVLRASFDVPIKELPLQPIAILNTDASTSKMEALAVAIDIGTIRDFAAWPPYYVARQILDGVYNPSSLVGSADPDAPADLLPSNGQYPTERVQYETILFDEFITPSSHGTHLSSKAPRPPGARQLGEDGPLDVSQLLSAQGGYEHPAIGGILTYTQSWYTKGLSLGHLIHGIALAPGESTKIAMIDWSRKVRTSAAETIQEAEDLDSNLSRARSISEITSAVAKETQTGQSAAQSASSATQVGATTGSAGLRSPFDPSSLGGTAPGVETSGTSFGASTGTTDATSWSTSSGTRDIGASLAQDIVDRTHQASHSARNRRASIVREVSQSESESISTRTLTNYNHMHALTIEYYEVVQLYRTVVELSKADRCLFVPMKIVDFTDDSVIDRYRATLAAAALTPEIADILNYPPGTTRIKCPAVATTIPFVPTKSTGSPLDDLATDAWNSADVRTAAAVTGGVVKILSDGRLVLPSDAVVYDVDFVSKDASLRASELQIVNSDGVTDKIPYDAQRGFVMAGHTKAIAKVLEISVTAQGVSGGQQVGFLSIIFDQSGNKGGFRIVFPIHFDSGSQQKVLATFTISPDVKAHLQNNRLYYSQVIWRSLNPATIGIMLSAYTWPIDGQQKPLVELVDPAPAAVIANYLVFRLSGDSATEHDAWLKKKRITVGSQREDQIPVPSGGVFAEAVLGRYNSAEKLDISRFWNWQDSPIPFQAPEIAAIQAGSRRDADNTVPGQLGAPVLNIVNPPSLPDPQGMGAILSAIQNGNMFRDMSGLAATIGLAQAGLAGAQQGATSAAENATKNAAIAADLGAKVAEIVGKIVGAYLTGGASAAGGLGGGSSSGLLSGSQGASKTGAMLNYAKGMDQRASGASTGASTGSGGSGDGGGSGGGGSQGGGSDESGSSESSRTGAASSNEERVLNSALGEGGPGGGPLSILNSLLGASPAAGGSIAVVHRPFGVDVFSKNGKVDWDKFIRESPDTRFVFVKATENDFADGRFSENWTALSKTPLLRGAYHFYRTNQDPEVQAANFISVVDKLDAAGDLPPVIDLEWQHDERDNAAAPKPADLVNDIRFWLQRVESHFGRKPIIYTAKEWWTKYTADSHEFSDYPLWVTTVWQQADKNNQVSEPPMFGGWVSWTFWQYGYETKFRQLATPPGLPGVPVDLFNGTQNHLELLAQVFKQAE